MHILTGTADKTINSVLILLTPDELKELLDKLRSVNADSGDHVHVSNIDFSQEITLAVYTSNNLRYFSEKVRKIIEMELSSKGN
jgi:hypothetical protein